MLLRMSNERVRYGRKTYTNTSAAPKVTKKISNRCGRLLVIVDSIQFRGAGEMLPGPFLVAVRF